MDKQELYRRIPKVDKLLETEGIRQYIVAYGYDCVRDAVRTELTELRAQIRTEKGRKDLLGVEQLTERIGRRLLKEQRFHLQKVLNGTGIILHTNLGRSPLGKESVSRVAEKISGYCNLEYDLDAGRRGERCAYIEKVLCELTGAEAALVVNNNAAALLLILCTFASGGEVIVSRGELVEIGGQFRIPDVMKQSGAVLTEIGTTNRTRLADYEQAITETTRAILKVHTSNYRIVGFTEETTIEQLVPLREQYQIPLIEDLGSGALFDLSQYGLPNEPSVRDALKAGADLVCFSGDKLLGGPQAGIIAGKREFIEKMRSNPLFRALRMDKITAAFLEEVLEKYRSMEQAVTEIPVLKMLTRSVTEIEKEAVALKNLLDQEDFAAEIRLQPCDSQVGGGALPMTNIPSVALCIRPSEISAECLSRRLRNLPVPVVARIEEDNLLLDLRTFEYEYAEQFVKMIKDANVFSGEWCAEDGI